MKTVFDTAVREELIRRITSINENSKPQWGQMTVGQMLKHCSMWDEMAQEKTLFKQSLLGKLVGKFALKDMMKDEPVKKNLPTVPAFKMTAHYDIDGEKQHWIKLLNEYPAMSNEGFLHPFFGHLTKEQTGRLVYKHADHHLRQFNA